MKNLENCKRKPRNRAVVRALDLYSGSKFPGFQVSGFQKPKKGEEPMIPCDLNVKILMTLIPGHVSKTKIGRL